MIRFHPDAAEEGRRQAAWYAERSLEAASRFDALLVFAWRTIDEAPLRRQQDGDGLRRYKLHDFPVRIVYWTDGSEILIVAIAHSSRQDGYWLSRIEQGPGD